MNEQLKNILKGIKRWVELRLGTKQDTLVSGQNIKTINDESLLGSGNIHIELEAIKNESIDDHVSEYVSGIDFYPASDEKGKIICDENTGKYYHAEQYDTLELDFTKFDKEDEDEVSITEIINLINEKYHIIVSSDQLDNHLFYYRKNEGIIIDTQHAIIFLLENYSSFPNIFLDKIEITAHSWYDKETMESDSVTTKVYADDYDDVHYNNFKFYTLPAGSSTSIPKSKTWEVDRRSIQHFVPDENDGHYETISIPPIDYCNIGLRDGGKFIIEKLVLHFVSSDSPDAYYNDDYYPSLFWTEFEPTISSLREPTENDEHIFVRSPNQDVNFTNYKESISGYEQIHTLEELTEGDYLIVSSTNDFIMSDPDNGIDKPSPANIDRENGIIIADDDYDVDYYADREFHIVNDGTIHMFSNAFEQYIGYTGNKNGINTNASDIYTNTASIVDNEITITCEGSGPSTLKHNNSGSLFRFYKTGQSPIQLFKKSQGNPYSWDRLIKRSEIAKVGLSNNYNDLDNLPVIGDLPVYDYEELPVPSKEYLNLLARNDHKLLEVVNSDGIDYDVVGFAKRYPNISGASPYTQMRDWLAGILKISAGSIDTSFFNYSTGISTSTTLERGIQIGSGNNYGRFDMLMSNNNGTPEFRFKSVSLVLEQYNNETSHIHVMVGNATDSYDERNIREIDIVKQEDIDFEYIDGSETLQSSSITIETDDFVNSLRIETEKIDSNDRPRVVIKELIFNDFHYYKEEGWEHNTDYKMRFEWNPISGAIKLIDLTGEVNQ